MNVRVTTDMPYGNAGDISIKSCDDHHTVGFMPDPHGGPEALWFCFRVEQDLAGARLPLQIVLKNVDNLLGGGQAPERIRPVIRRRGADWGRLAAGKVIALPDDRRHIAWKVEAPDPFIEIALCYPYGPPELDALIRDTGLSADVIGLSQAGRPLIRLSSQYGRKSAQPPGLYVMSRQHSGETSGCWALDGFLREMAAMGDDAPLIWTVPLANIDGVMRGDYGKDNFPYDLNRAWGVPPDGQPMRHETLVYQRDVGRWRGRCKPLLGIDWHAPGACENSGVYAYLPEPDQYPEMHAKTKAWVDDFGDALGEFAAADFGRVANYASRWKTPSFSKFFYVIQGLPGFTFEVPYAMIGDRVLAREDYQEIGARVARSLVKRLKAL
jgi:hypothetical protein